MIRGLRLRAAVVAAAALALLAGGAPASARGKPDHGTSTQSFKQVNRVSDQDLGGRVLMDADAVNSWALALGPTSPLWVSNNGTGTATIYSGGVHGKRVTKSPLTVDVGDAPTGAVFNDTTDFVVPGTGLPAMFIFVSETGDITAWNRNAGDTAVVVKPAEPVEDHAIYKGVSILHTPGGPLLRGEGG